MVEVKSKTRNYKHITVSDSIMAFELRDAVEEFIKKGSNVGSRWWTSHPLGKSDGKWRFDVFNIAPNEIEDFEIMLVGFCEKLGLELNCE